MDSINDISDLIGKTIKHYDPYDNIPIECTIVLIEFDEGIGFVWLKANDDSLNKEWEPKLNTNIYTLVPLSEINIK